ncbi:SPW repeat domain-containing protein [Haloterrigena alkaliphila]|uniref:SPW repeat-containing integral membrane domain-containing protein n=1 Tax=Haloterrigena alkaliphila TaxID=2816475 RepID=A0A8A2VFY7_9EURY|nr:hypothetical protein [Haloterrigena alkaliphila]QSW99610.1 hypothetical protein J0X25_01215 [Haloterrigena alkaliphila]
MSDSNRDDRDPNTASGTSGGTGRDERIRNASDVDSGTGVGDRPGGRDPRDDGTAIADEERRRKTSLLSIVIAAVGVWVAVSLLFFEFGEAALWNNALVGGVVALAGVYNAYRLSNDIPLSTGVSSLLVLLGLWLVVAPVVLDMPDGLFWSTIASGLLVAGLAGYNVYEAREARQVATDSARA